MAARNFYFIACHEPINAGLLLDDLKYIGTEPSVPVYAAAHRFGYIIVGVSWGAPPKLRTIS